MYFSQRKIDILLYQILLVLTAGILVSQTLRLDQITSWMFIATFPLTVVMWLRSIRRTVTGMDILMVTTVALAALSVLLNASITGVMPGFSYLKKLIMFAMTLMFFQTASRTQVTEEMVKIIHLLVDILVAYLIGFYLVMNVQAYEIGGRLSVYLTFRLSNSNLTAMFLICLYMLELYRLFTPEKWYAKTLHIIMALCLAWFLFQTRSRNAIIVMVIFTAFCGWLILRGKVELRIGKGWAAGIAAFPALFVGAYYLVLSVPVIKGIFDFLVSEGKHLESRLEIWNIGLKALGKSPVLGDYSGLSQGSGMFQMHNSHVDIACSYGVPVLVLTCILLGRFLHNKGRVYTQKSSFIYMLGFAGTLILGMGEAAVFSGGIGLYVFAGCFLMLANYSEGEGEPA